MPRHTILSSITMQPTVDDNYTWAKTDNMQQYDRYSPNEMNVTHAMERATQPAHVSVVLS